ncbi:MAG: CARDB domain-containing protein [bacterium]|nr:CARDB domain-containing protein [bacterium]
MADKTEVQKIELQKIEVRKEVSKEPRKETAKTGLFSNILAVTGLVILIAIVFWGLFNLGVLSKSWFTGLFSASSKSIVVTVPKTKIPTGEEFPILWRYTPKAPGTYALLYQCREGFQFKTTIAAGTQSEIPCGVGYTMPSKDNTFKVTPVLSGTSSLDVPLSIIFIPSAPAATGTPVSRAQGNASVTIINAVNASPATTAKISPAPEPKVSNLPAPAGLPERSSQSGAKAGGQAETLAVRVPGLPDLSVRILSHGVIDPISGEIVSREPTSPEELVAVRFLISNVGGTSTGTWYFTAQLPIYPDYAYASPAQVSLARGASIENMLRFKNAVPGGAFHVSVDPANQVNELSENNNTASVSI